MINLDSRCPNRLGRTRPPQVASCATESPRVTTAHARQPQSDPITQQIRSLTKSRYMIVQPRQKNLALPQSSLMRWALGCILLACNLSLGNIANSQSPNIVILFADDLGYGELGCQGNPEIPTPHIDSIAANGVRFTSGYVTGPNCSPSRAGMLTGRIPTRFGYEFNPTGAKNEEPDLASHPSKSR